MTTTEALGTLLRSLGIPLYGCQSSYPRPDAQQNLRGRSHYVDDDTLRAFGARILDSGRAYEGRLYWIVESVVRRPDEAGRRRFRFVAFDVGGRVLTKRDEWHSSSKAARKAGMEWVNACDAEAATMAVLERRLRDAKDVVGSIESFLAEAKTGAA